MNKLISCLVGSALLYSSNSEILERGYGLRGEAQIFRNDGDIFKDDGNQVYRFRDGGNYIANGNFDFPQLQAENQITDSIPGWASNEVERGIGSYYNLKWGNTVVVQLDGNQNNVMTQSISLHPGRYILSFNWAAPSRHAQTSEMSVYWSGNLIYEVSAADNSINSSRIPIYVRQSGKYVLQIRGEGISDGIGMTVANFRLTKDTYKPHHDSHRQGYYWSWI